MSDSVKGKYWEDFEVGMRFITRGRTVTEADIVNFAGLSGDWNPLHVDTVHASAGPFGERIAHGLLGLTIASGLMQSLELYPDTLVAFLGLNWRFRAPIKIGDTIRVEQVIAEKRETKNKERGILIIDTKVLNQQKKIVQEGDRQMMLLRRPS
jgi:acyl dehydratase